MAYLSTGELTQLRADATATLGDETCTILSPATGLNSIGEQTITWGTTATSVACRLRPNTMASGLQAVGGQMNTVAPWIVTLPHGTAVYPGYRLVIDSVTYEVLQSWDEETWKTASRVPVMRIE